MPACLSRPGDAPMPRALAMSACLSRPGDARMPLAPWRRPHASRPGDLKLPHIDALAQFKLLRKGDLAPYDDHAGEPSSSP
ncbi:hypothetical protein VNO80_10191 [Phaseolus coccineus]|uniref:Uncharacterized protein n=1 Tax=Phaseolus coccineus TaxID=3886 RepID=A0AAN9NE29_PHACN